MGIQILKDLGVSKIRLMTNNPDKIDQINDKDAGLEITERVPLAVETRPQDIEYLRTKKIRFGHFL